MRNIKLTVEYDGTLFNGWQVQAQGPRSVQGQIESALKKIFKKQIRLIGSGRTDSGVHALGQVANFKVATNKSTEEIASALNGNIPEDVVVLRAEDVNDSFHSQYSAKRKTYRYSVLNRRASCAIDRPFSYHFPYKLNVRKMREEAKALVGKKDFRSFMASDAKMRAKIQEKNTTRTIYDLTIKKKGDYLTFDITANGFLYKIRSPIKPVQQIYWVRLQSSAYVVWQLSHSSVSASNFDLQTKTLQSFGKVMHLFFRWNLHLCRKAVDTQPGIFAL